MTRWHVIITYRTDAGENPVEHGIDELETLHDLVENGPWWDTIIDIKITRTGGDPSMTVERAAKL